MDNSILIGALMVITLGAVIVFALVSKKKVDDRRDDPDAPKSTLASDAPDERSTRKRTH